MTSTHILRYTPTPAPPPPPNTTRSFLPTPSGPLELLTTTPTPPHTPTPPILFLHGGFGTAADFHRLLPLPCSYSLSLRAHGASYPLPYRTHLFTTRTQYLSDIQTAVQHLQSLHNSPVILIGHSSGGGLAQDYISRGYPGVCAIGLLGAVPGSGGWRVNWHWITQLDRWFLLRAVWMLWHPRAALSSTRLVWNAFYSPAVEEGVVRECEGRMSEYESMVWPLSMLWRFVDRGRVVEGVRGRVLGLWGRVDRLVRVEEGTKLVAWYRGAGVTGVEKVRFEVVEGGHHFMSDVGWEECYKVLEGWVQDVKREVADEGEVEEEEAK